MAFLVVVLSLLGWLSAILGLGIFIHDLIIDRELKRAHLYNQEIEFTVYFFLGMAGFSLFAACLNFLIPIGNNVSFILMFMGWGLMMAKIRKIFSLRMETHIPLFVVLFVYICVVPLTPVINHDTGLYHWQAIKWLIQEPLVRGLANLHDRFGFNSTSFPFSALVDLPPKIFASPNFISNSMALFFYGVGVFLSLRSCFNGNKSLSNMFMASTAVPWLSTIAQVMNSPSPDLPVMLIIFLVIYLTILSLEDLERRPVCLSLAAILSAFAVSLKLSAAPLVPIVCGWCFLDFWLARIRRRSFGLPNKKSSENITRNPAPVSLIITSGILIVWLARGLLLSGCPAYPSTVGCMRDLKWTVSMDSVTRMAEVIQGWARSPGPGFREALNNWRWLPDWLTRNMWRELELVVLFLLGICALIVGVARIGVRAVTEKPFLVPALTAIIGVAFWFLSAPDPRFAYGFLYSLALLLVVNGILSLQSSRVSSTGRFGKGPSKIFAGLIAGVLLISFLCQYNAWTGTGSGFAQGAIFILISAMALGRKQIRFWAFCIALLLIGNVPQQTFRIKDWFAWESFPAVAVREETTRQGLVVRQPIGTDQCWDTELPCAPSVPDSLKAEVSKAGRYKMFWLQEE